MERRINYTTKLTTPQNWRATASSFDRNIRRFLRGKRRWRALNYVEMNEWMKDDDDDDQLSLPDDPRIVLYVTNPAF